MKKPAKLTEQAYYYPTLLGTMVITEDEGYIVSISIVDTSPVNNSNEPGAAILKTIQQLEEYFEGKRFEFDLPLKPAGTPFQQLVWQQLLAIPYGVTISYAQQANQMNNPLAIRAIASANGKNKFWIVIPCHRVIGSDGALTGYAGGVWRKKWLLEHETKTLRKGQIALEF